ncbi:MAG: hypothetical protein ACKVX7_14255 [Planctomycetota bacterium]
MIVTNPAAADVFGAQTRVTPHGGRARAGLLAGFACLYLWQLAPVLQWGDPAKLVLLASQARSNVLSGGGHGLLILLINALDFVVPGGIEIAARLVSPLASLGALAILWRVLAGERIGVNARLVALSALGVSHLFWFMSEIVESYALLGFLFALWLLAAQRFEARPTLARACALFGVGFAGVLNHQLLLLLWPVQFVHFAVMLPTRERRTWWTAHGVLLAVVGLIACLTPSSFAVAGQSIAFHLERWVNPLQGAALIWVLPLLLLAQFPSAAFVFASRALIAGSARLRRGGLRERQNLLHVSCIGVMSCFALSYGLGRAFFLLLPVYIVFAIWIARGFDAWCEVSPRRARYLAPILASTLVLPIAGYQCAWRSANALQIYPLSDRVLPYRDVNRYYLWPGKRGEDGATRFVADLRNFQPGPALVLADFRISSILRCAQELAGSGDYEVWGTDYYFGFRSEDETRHLINAKIEECRGRGLDVVIADRASLQIYLNDQRIFDFLPELTAKHVVELGGHFRRIRFSSLTTTRAQAAAE